jgi:CheY-like chemotaxis protein
MDTPLDPQQREFVRTIRGSGDALLTILNDVLDYSKIEAGRMSLENTPFDMHSICEDVHRLLLPVANQRGLTHALEYASDMPNLVTGDPARVRQVLLNLISNAVKFTERGGVRVVVTRIDINTARVAVVDTGIGIPAELLGRLFARFTQADSSTTRRYGGTGLGLAISKRLVELMGGRIEVTSTAGAGSTFSFDLPLIAEGTVSPSLQARRPEREASPAGTRPLTGGSMRVLLVEDNPVNQRVASHMLQRLGCIVEVADHGGQAIERLSRNRYDLVLMDCQMPEMDGLEATRLIRDTGSAVLDHAVPIVAMTANAFSEDRERCLAAGMNDFLSKPVGLEQLREMVTRWASPAAAREARQTA